MPDEETPTLQQIAELFHGAPEFLVHLLSQLGMKLAAVATRTIRRIATGSGVLTKRITGRIREDKILLVPLLLVGFVTWIYVRLHPVESTSIAVIAWLLMSLANAGERTQQPAPETGESAQDDPDEADAERVREAIEHTVAEAVQNGRKGIHLGELFKVLRGAGHLEDIDTGAFREHLDALGIPVREQLGIVIDGKKTNQRGVHHEDLVQALGHMLRLPPPLVPDLTGDDGPPEDAIPFPTPSESPSPASLTHPG